MSFPSSCSQQAAARASGPVAIRRSLSEERATPPVTAAAPATPLAPTPAPAPATAPASPRRPRPRGVPATLVGKGPCGGRILAGNDELRDEDGPRVSGETYRFKVLQRGEGGAKPTFERLDGARTRSTSSRELDEGALALAAYERMNALRKAGKAGFTRDAMMQIYPSKGTGAPTTTSLARRDGAGVDRERQLLPRTAFWRSRVIARSTRRASGLGLSSARPPGSRRARSSTPGGSPPASSWAARSSRRESTLTLPPNDAVARHRYRVHRRQGPQVNEPMPFRRRTRCGCRFARRIDPHHAARPAADPSEFDSCRGCHERGCRVSARDARHAAERVRPRGIRSEYRRGPSAEPISSRHRERVRPRGQFQIFQKVGQAYGFLIHNAYIVDKASGKSFFLIAAIYANADGVPQRRPLQLRDGVVPAPADVGEAFTRDAFED